MEAGGGLSENGLVAMETGEGAGAGGQVAGMGGSTAGSPAAGGAAAMETTETSHGEAAGAGSSSNNTSKGPADEGEAQAQAEVEALLESLKDFVPTIPPEVTAHYMESAGCVTTDMRVQQLMALAAEKFVSDVTNSALQFCKIRQQSKKKSAADDAFVLRTEDLVAALRDTGINVSKPEYLISKGKQ
ncbi:transcription initiation factor TFIID subunit 10 [Thecamonas trahens ATCC 50062]|uniref:Transcription initiation factor TFIID subunit 10 n=1 Tax=Thecamonas trahens ATCC 50062 TaxID=461836 RepID=A0A0L0DKK8_THETB|nr:transcription initiation factor TFIID subunit 10 [Thecamonas trahens ATCC 50062]KNC52847.1 transcription initiation factor TFIID subunit 10 [Thecamonas trahens ATCC 50062]|eukprot:XP_013754950.1 transcription initiation factor TFIID subunit 10 [Thecamonas trahens ATCC 50062]